ncbi:T9SS type A sorting domain-containing protein [Polaribacter sp.]|uniref:T9SS type A sorting domain-containing protein n=1 Tax=Polaribacter sp. TaxID=1920175 RepID=UPI003EFB0007
MKKILTNKILLLSLFFGINTMNAQGPGGETSNLGFWIKADAGSSTTSNGSYVSEWDDQSSNGFDLESSGTRRPTFNVSGTNFNPTMVFDGSAILDSKSSFAANNILGAGGMTSYVVAKRTAGGYIFSHDSGVLGGEIKMTNTESGFAGLLSTTQTFTSEINNEFSITSAKLSTLFSGPNLTVSQSFYKNGMANGGGSSALGIVGTLLNNLLGASATLQIGSVSSTFIGTTYSGELTGEIAEIIMFKSVHSAATEQKVESYLSLKYGMTLGDGATDYLASDGTTKMWDATINAAYKYDIAGIGKDVNSDLNQKQSKSVNSDAIVTMGLSTIETTNAANTATIADKNFMVWGNNNGTATWSATGSPENYNLLSRQWRVAETGTVAAVKLQFDVDNANFDVPTAKGSATYYLLYDSNNDNDLSDETPIALTNSSGSIWETSTNINFSNGMEFTLATESLMVANGTDWNTASNWLPNAIPTATDDVVIPDGVTMSIAAGDSGNVNSIKVQAGGALTITPTASLSITSGVLEIESDATKSGTLIGKDYTGQISYKRYVDDQWHIVSSMVTDQSLNDFVTNVDNNITTGAGGTKYALGPYSNTANSWDYYTSGDIAAAGDFDANIGYTFKRNTAGFATFTGTNRSTDAITTVAAKVAGDGYRSLGNPFPSYMNVNVGATNFLSANDAVLEIGTKTIFLFNLAQSKYVAVGSLSGNKYIVPGQGFLIKTAAGGTVTISEDLQSNQTGGTLNRSISSEVTRIEMSLTSGSLFGKANVYFHESGAKGMDNNDYLVFEDYDFDIYSKLTDGSYANKNFNTQTLPNKDYENTVVSLGVNAAANSQLKFVFSHEALPTGYMLFLEDKELGTMTRVDDGSSYTTTSSTNGTGRFFLHTSTSVLATEATIASKVAIFSTNNSVQIKGLSLGKTTITMYDLLGRVIVKDSFSDRNSHVISTSSLNKGSVYVVDIETTEGKVTKKVIIQ